MFINPLHKTEEMIGYEIRAWDFEPCPGRDDRYVEGEVVAYHRDRDLLEVRVTFDSTKLNRETIFTAPFGHMMMDEDPIEPGFERIVTIRKVS